MSYFNSAGNPGSFIPTTQVVDTSQLDGLTDISPDLKNFLYSFITAYNNSALRINSSVSGFMPLVETLTGRRFFSDPSILSSTANSNAFAPVMRMEYQTVYHITSLGAGVTNVPHGLTTFTIFSFTDTDGFANNTTTGNYYPLPFVSSGGAANIEVKANNTNIVITNSSGQTFTNCYIWLRYLKQ